MYTILGATGNVGSKIVDILIGKGELVRVVARSIDRLAHLEARGADVKAGDLRDTAFLTRVLRGSKSVFTLIPPNYTAANFAAYQDEVGESITKAIHESGVTHVVNLSSVGAELRDKTDPIAGAHRQEQRLNAVPILNVLHLRAAYFMENTLMNVPLVASKGIMGSAMRGDLKMPMIATRDIAQEAAERLLRRDFSGTSVKYLLGERNISQQEVSAIFGRKLRLPDLAYVQFSYTDAEKGMIAAGLSPDVARQFIEMNRAFNDGLVGADLVRTEENTTATAIEDFADVFAHIYEETKAA